MSNTKEEVFISKNGNRQIFDDDGLVAQFKATLRGSVGMFSTSDPKIIKKLKDHPEFNKTFGQDIKFKGTKDNPKILKGAVVSKDEAEEIAAKAKAEGKAEALEEAKESVKKDQAKLIKEFAALSNMVVGEGGKIRDDAEKKNVERYNALRKELGL